MFATEEKNIAVDSWSVVDLLALGAVGNTGGLEVGDLVDDADILCLGRSDDGTGSEGNGGELHDCGFGGSVVSERDGL